MTSRIHFVPSLLLVVLTLLPIGCNTPAANQLRGRGEEAEPEGEKKGSGKGRGDGDPTPDGPPPAGEGIDPNDPKVAAYLKQVKPIFDRRCAECHHAGKDLDLTTFPANTKPTMAKVLASLGTTMPPSPREKMTAEEIAIVKGYTDGL